jgi:YcaO cyclodehydratase, ATP-ad Mg2+-binding
VLRDLQKRYPLPEGWAPPDAFAETIEFGASRIELSGLSVTSPQGQLITGSAASADASHSCVLRSYFELLERVSVIAAMSARIGEYELRDPVGRSRGRVARGAVFPESSEPDRWQPSRSNGVALHTDWKDACDRAAAELVERDWVLRSWYGESVPERSVLSDALVPEGVRRLADWQAFRFASGASAIGKGLTVIAVVGIPRDDGIPLTYGFAGGVGIGEATRAAAGEALQRFGFLFGEEIPREAPKLSPTPDFHQEFFLYPPSRGLLEAWLCGGLPESRPREEEAHRPDEPSTEASSPLFVDLTPPHLRGSLFVAKAVCPMAEPLVFGAPRRIERGQSRAGGFTRSRRSLATAHRESDGQRAHFRWERCASQKHAPREPTS